MQDKELLLQERRFSNARSTYKSCCLTKVHNRIWLQAFHTLRFSGSKNHKPSKEEEAGFCFKAMAIFCTFLPICGKLFSHVSCGKEKCKNDSIPEIEPYYSTTWT